MSSTDTPLLANEWVRSFIALAHKGDIRSPDNVEKTQATAYWIVKSLSEKIGGGDRRYIAINLDGRYYDQDKKIDIKPHIEVPKSVINKADELFPRKIVQSGLSLHSPLWVYQEIRTLKNNIFSESNSDTKHVLNLLDDRMESLRNLLKKATSDLSQYWSVIEGLQIIKPQELSETISKKYTTQEIAHIINLSDEFEVEITHTGEGLDTNTEFLSRRIGVWCVNVYNKHTRLNNKICVATPRLTYNSMFNDPNYSPSSESPAASLVRTLLIYRLFDTYLKFAKIEKNKAVTGSKNSKHPNPTFKIIQAQPGQKMPEPSLESIINLVQTYQTYTQAYNILKSWASTRCVLTISEEEFKKAYLYVQDRIRKAETIDKSKAVDILPIAWKDGKVVRVTFSKPYEM